MLHSGVQSMNGDRAVYKLIDRVFPVSSISSFQFAEQFQFIYQMCQVMDIACNVLLAIHFFEFLNVIEQCEGIESIFLTNICLSRVKKEKMIIRFVC